MTLHGDKGSTWQGDKYIIGSNKWLVWIFEVSSINRILKTAYIYDIRYYVLWVVIGYNHPKYTKEAGFSGSISESYLPVLARSN
jgi:hypothetical protein